MFTRRSNAAEVMSIAPDRSSRRDNLRRQSRLVHLRWIGAGLLDQVVIASANAATTLLGLVLLADRHQAGQLVLALGVGYFAMYLNRAFVGDVLIALGSRYDDDRRHALVRDGLATAATAGIAGAGLFVILWWAVPDLRYLIWIAPFVPLIMLHDTARCGYLAARRPDRALVIDLVWVTVQGLAVVALIAGGWVTPGRLLALWGLGATAGATSYLVRTRITPWGGSPRRWIVTTRHLAGWFTATGIVGQVHMLAVNFLVAVRLSPVEVAGLRLTQTVMMQPVQNLITAVQGLLVPWTSRTAHAAESGQPDSARTLGRQTLRLALGCGLLGGVFVLVAWPLGALLLTRTGKYADVAPLALPVSLQAAIYLVQLPFTAALRGMHRARSLFFQYVICSAVGLTGLVTGAAWFGLAGAAWGLPTGSLVGLFVMIGFYRYALRQLTPAEPAPAPVPAPAPKAALKPAPVPLPVPVDVP